jgi:hypothetical protein
MAKSTGLAQIWINFRSLIEILCPNLSQVAQLNPVKLARVRQAARTKIKLIRPDTPASEEPILYEGLVLETVNRCAQSSFAVLHPPQAQLSFMLHVS